MNKAQEYMNCVTGLLQTIMDKEAQNIEAAAQALKNTMMQDGMIYSFGTGHSVILCSESYRRAGGLANCCPILDQRVMPFPKAGRPLNEGIIEREEGVTAEIFKRYPLKKGDSMFVFCYGGKNATSIDAGLLCKELGVTTICSTRLPLGPPIPPACLRIRPVIFPLITMGRWAMRPSPLMALRSGRFPPLWVLPLYSRCAAGQWSWPCRRATPRMCC